MKWTGLRFQELAQRTWILAVMSDLVAPRRGHLSEKIRPPGIEPGTIWLLQHSTVRCSTNWAIAGLLSEHLSAARVGVVRARPAPIRIAGVGPSLGRRERVAIGGQSAAPKGSRNAETRDRTGDLQIFSLTLSQLSYRGGWAKTRRRNDDGRAKAIDCAQSIALSTQTFLRGVQILWSQAPTAFMSEETWAKSWQHPKDFPGGPPP